MIEGDFPSEQPSVSANDEPDRKMEYLLIGSPVANQGVEAMTSEGVLGKDGTEMKVVVKQVI